VIATVAFVLGLVAVVGVAAGRPLAVVPLVVGLPFAVSFFRDPERVPPAGERFVVSPADGRVIAVVPEERVPFLTGPVTRVSIFMSPLNAHVNRSPVTGRIGLVEHTPGKFRAAFADKASLDNERNAIVVESGARRFLMVQIAGALARRIVCHVTPGREVGRGERVGLIMFGSRVDLYLPPDVRPLVAEGDRVYAGSSAVAEVPA
jgi:phosphatidylserine decarboxylase